MIKSNKSEEITYEEIEVKLLEYKQNLSQIEAILEREKEKSMQMQSGASNISRITDLLKVQKDLKNAINFQEELRKFKIQTDPGFLNPFAIDPILHIGRICTAYFEQEANWFLAIINEVNEKDKTVELTWLGYKEKGSVPWSHCKVSELLKKENLEVNMLCDAIYYEEGKWYNAMIETISEHGVHVKYKKYNDVEVVSFDSIRFTPEQNLLNMKKKEEALKKTKSEVSENDLEFKLPEYLKITPTDNEVQRLSKRKRVKSMKNTHKQKIIEKVSKDKQDNWLNHSQAHAMTHKSNKSGGYVPLPLKKIDKRVDG